MSQIWMCDRCGKIANTRTRKYGIMLGSQYDGDEIVRVEVDEKCYLEIYGMFNLNPIEIEENTGRVIEHPKENGGSA